MVFIKLLLNHTLFLLIFVIFSRITSKKIDSSKSGKPQDKFELGERELENESTTLFESYSNSLKFLLEGMFGPNYKEIISSNNTENLPLCSSNNQMENKGCNVMLYSCSRNVNKFSCYFYYWSFCQCSRPWNIKILNYIIPSVYDCHPSIASEDDFQQMKEFNENQIKANFKSSFSENLEIPVGECSVNVVFVTWIVALISIIIWIIRKIYLLSSYFGTSITSKKKM